MAKRHHFIPACHLGRFSTESINVLRSRRVAVLRKSSSVIFTQKADQIGAVNHLYRWTEEHRSDIDIESLWSSYENHLTFAVDQLVEPGSPRLTASTWLRTLVPFIVGLLVRGTDFNHRHNMRITGGNPENLDAELLNILVESDNSNMARLIEFQRLLAGVICAHWTVLHLDDYELITNDLGYTVRRQLNGEYSYIVPLSARHAVEICPAPERLILRPKGLATWVPIIGHVALDRSECKGLNESIASLAQSFIVGGTKNNLASHRERLNEFCDVPEPGQLGLPSGRHAIVHEFTWHRLISVICFSPGDRRIPAFEIDWSALGRGWAPVVVLPANLRTFPHGLESRPDGIHLQLFHLSGFSAQATDESISHWVISGGG